MKDFYRQKELHRQKAGWLWRGCCPLGEAGPPGQVLVVWFETPLLGEPRPELRLSLVTCCLCLALCVPSVWLFRSHLLLQ